MGTVGTVPACGPNQRGARVSERRRGGSGYGTRNSSGLPDGARSAPLAPGRVRHVRVEIGAAREASRRLGSPPRLARHQSVLDSPSRSGDGSGAPAQSRIANPDVDLPPVHFSRSNSRTLRRPYVRRVTRVPHLGQHWRENIFEGTVVPGPRSSCPPRATVACCWPCHSLPRAVPRALE